VASAMISRVPLMLVISATLSCSSGSNRPAEPAPVAFEDRLVIGENDDKSPLGIPAAQLPAAGACRLWKPGRPLREQARGGACGQIEPTAPPESWVLYRPAQDPRLIHVRVIDPIRPGVVTQVRVYDAERGTYLGSRQAIWKQERT
jgi:hypothetical protein